MAATGAGGVSDKRATRLYIHAGFAKAGSTSIQVALLSNARALAEQSVFEIGSDLAIGSGGTPAWTIQTAANHKNSLTEKLIGSLASARPGDRIVLSSENLQEPNMPALFEGIDEHIETHLIFYFRHQVQYIPSAWKQWYSKEGTTLQDYVKECLDRGYPSYLASVTAWRNLLPRAKITVRPLVRDLLIGGAPDADFFHQLGVDTTDMVVGHMANRSLDFSVIHLMMKNADRMYAGPHDVRAQQWFNHILGSRKPVVQLPILSKADNDLIENRFRAENFELISKYCNYPEPESIYASLLSSRESATKSYTEMSEIEVIMRAFRVLIAGLGVEKMSSVMNDVILDQIKQMDK